MKEAILGLLLLILAFIGLGVVAYSELFASHVIHPH